MGGRMYLGNELVTPAIIDVSLEFSDLKGDPMDNAALAEDLNAKQDVLESGTNIKTVNGTSLLGSGNITIDSLPSQAGNNGKFLSTDGTDASWTEIVGFTASEVQTIWESINV